MPRPHLPEWITHAAVPGYSTAHLLCPGERKLYGTESLYGDWEGEVLLLAKDFGPSSFLRARVEAGDPAPYRHEPSWSTNVRLRKLAGPYEGRGLLYGSALANLLRDDNARSGALPNRAEAMRYGVRVLQEVTLPSMPRLEWIVCLGGDAWECASRATGTKGDYAAARDRGRPCGMLVPAFHPVARVGFRRLQLPWRVLAD